MAGKYTVQVSRELHDPRWDEFVERCPGGHHEQTSLWGQVKNCYGWEPIRLIASKGKEIMGGAQILKRPVNRIGHIGYVTQGPLPASDKSELASAVVMELDRVARHERISILVVVPPYGGQTVGSVLQEAGFVPKPEFLPPSGLMRSTLILDLSEDLDRIMARMRKRTREQIRQGYRQGMIVREGEGQDIETFCRLMWALCERRGVSPTPPQRDFFQNLWTVFHPQGCVKLFLAEFRQEPIAGGIAFAFGDAVRLWKVGWAGEHAERNPTKVMYWEAIKWAKEHGYRYFDFVWIDIRCAEALLRGEVIPSNAVDGMAFFKIGFGGQAVLLPETYIRFYHPLARLFLRAGGSKLLASRAVTRAASRLWSAAGPGGEG